MDRDIMVGRIQSPRRPWDVVIVGGGASGLGCAVDAALRGYRTVLFERGDFACGTSSRSTKLIHGGVRYLRRGNVSLVLESLHERGILRGNAPHLVSDLRFVVPTYDWWEGPFYGVGLRLYDALAGRYGFGRSRNLSREETIESLPNVEREGLRGGVAYTDGQFDDARLAVALAATAVDAGATVLNYAEVTGLVKSGGITTGVSVRDLETGHLHRVEAKVVINATGVGADTLRRMDDPDAQAVIRPSRGSHIVLDKSFLAGDNAIMVPQTDDGRVLFAIPWYDRVLVGTTDVAAEGPDTEPAPTRAEVDYLLEHIGRYLDRDPTHADVRSAFAGLRPLASGGSEGDTASITRDHEVIISQSGLVTLAGGKWTTYRKMAEDTLDRAAAVGALDDVPCRTRQHHLRGFDADAGRFGLLARYGSDASAIKDLLAEKPALAAPLDPASRGERADAVRAEVVWAVRQEMARTVEDVLARRIRLLFVDVEAARRAAPVTAHLMAAELGRDDGWRQQQLERFERVCTRFGVPSAEG